MKVVLLLCCLLMTGCTNAYKNFIQSLEERQVTSCIKADLAIGGLFGAGSGTGAVHVITATGGAQLPDCVRALHFGQVPSDGDEPTIWIVP